MASEERARRRRVQDEELEFGKLVDDDADGHFDQEEILPGRTIDKKYKNTLESDEEDDEVEAEKRNRLKVLNLKHREKKTIIMDGGIEVTPFNMRDEMEDGHFDRTGNFIFDKPEQKRKRLGPGTDDDDSEEDAWADSVDNLPVYTPNKDKSSIDQVSASTSGVKRKHEQVDSDEDDGGPSSFMADEPNGQNRAASVANSIDRYKKIVSFMLPDETVQKTIQRLGKNVPRGRQFKTKANNTNSDAAKKALEDKANLDKFIELAHNIMETVDLKIYEKTYEQIRLILKQAPQLSAAQSLERDLDSDSDGQL